MKNTAYFFLVLPLTWIGTEVLDTSSLWQDLLVLAVVALAVSIALYGMSSSSNNDSTGKD